MVQMGAMRPKIGNAFHMARKSLQLIGERSAIKVIDLRVHPHDPFTQLRAHLALKLAHIVIQSPRCTEHRPSLMISKHLPQCVRAFKQPMRVARAFRMKYTIKIHKYNRTGHAPIVHIFNNVAV